MLISGEAATDRDTYIAKEYNGVVPKGDQPLLMDDI